MKKEKAIAIIPDISLHLISRNDIRCFFYPYCYRIKKVIDDMKNK